MRSSCRWICVLILALSAGCFRPAFQPSGAGLAPNLARQACEEANAKRVPLESLRVLADATISSDSERATFRYVVLSKEPSSFRVDVLPVNGAFTLGLLVSHNGKAFWLNAQEKTYAEDENERRLVAEYLGLRGVSRETAVALMTGTLPPLSCPDVRLYALSGGDRLLVDDRSRVAWRVRDNSAELVSVQVLDESGDSVEMEGAFSAAPSGSVESLRLEVFSPARARVDLSLTKIIRNPKLSDQLFEVKPPQGYSRVD